MHISIHSTDMRPKRRHKFLSKLSPTSAGKVPLLLLFFFYQFDLILLSDQNHKYPQTFSHYLTPQPKNSIVTIIVKQELHDGKVGRGIFCYGVKKISTYPRIFNTFGKLFDLTIAFKAFLTH